MTAKERLEQYVKENKIYQDFIGSKIRIKDLTDFGVFCINHCSDIKEILEENEKLKKQYCERTDCSGRLGTSKKVEALEKENEELKKQLEYLRSGEYLNQLKFERDMLQHIVENSEVSKEDKEFIDMTHRNTELLKENEELKKQLKGTTHCFDEEEHERLKKQLEDVLNENRKLRKNLENCMTFEEYRCTLYKKVKLKVQQKEFINYLEDEIEKATTNPYTKLSEYGMNRIHIYKEILQKYKEIVNGGNKE